MALMASVAGATGVRRAVSARMTARKQAVKIRIAISPAQFGPPDTLPGTAEP